MYTRIMGRWAQRKSPITVQEKPNYGARKAQLRCIPSEGFEGQLFSRASPYQRTTELRRRLGKKSVQKPDVTLSPSINSDSCGNKPVSIQIRSQTRRRVLIRGAMNGSSGTGSSTDQAEHSNASGLKPSEYVAAAKKLIYRRMLVGIQDGRFFVGNFYCTDKQGNIILQDAIEYRSTRRTSPSAMEHRGVGLILIPFSCQTSCHVDCSVDEQLSLLSLE